MALYALTEPPNLNTRVSHSSTPSRASSVAASDPILPDEVVGRSTNSSASSSSVISGGDLKVATLAAPDQTKRTGEQRKQQQLT